MYTVRNPSLSYLTVNTLLTINVWISTYNDCSSESSRLVHVWKWEHNTVCDCYHTADNDSLKLISKTTAGLLNLTQLSYKSLILLHSTIINHCESLARFTVRTLSHLHNSIVTLFVKQLFIIIIYIKYCYLYILQSIKSWTTIVFLLYKLPMCQKWDYKTYSILYLFRILSIKTQCL